MHVRPRHICTIRVRGRSHARSCARTLGRAVHWCLVAAIFVTAAAGFSSSANAQLQNAPVDIEIFRPAMDSKGFVTVNSSAVLGQYDISFGLVTSYARRPLRFTGAGMPFNNQAGVFSVDTLLRPSLQAAIGFLSLPHLGAELGIIIPMGVVAGRSTPSDDGGTPTATLDDREWTFGNQGLGDIQIHPKLRFLNATRRGLGFAIMPSIILGTGDKNSFLGEGKTMFQPMAILDTELGYLGRFRASVNAGMRIRGGTSTYVNNAASFTTPPQFRMQDITTGGSIEVKNEVIGGIGISYGVVPQKFDLVAELYGNYGLDSHRTENATAARETMKPSAEAIGAIKLYLARNSFFEIGGGYKVSNGYGSAAPRGFVGFIFEPSIGDRDGDGYKDDVDQCPDDPEDFDDFEDEDGCPEPDNDKDGILDDADKCPNEPETKNGYQDDDGCPDPDNDNDGVPDVRDKCPNEPETKNNYQDDDGCPDDIPVEVKKFTGVIEGINYKTGSAEILPGSYSILDRAVKVLQDFPDVNIEISGHTDSRGKADYNRDLSQRRADSVKNYFISRGIDAKRLTSIGYGMDRPIADNRTQSGRGRNRRTEFRLINPGDR